MKVFNRWLTVTVFRAVMLGVLLLTSVLLPHCVDATIEMAQGEPRELTAETQRDSLVASLPGGKEMQRKRDSVFQAALPKLLVSVVSRKASDWYGIRSHWEPYFGNIEVLTTYIRVKAEEFLQVGRVGEAIQLYVTASRFNNQEGNYIRSTELGNLAYREALAGGDSAKIAMALIQLAIPAGYAGDSASALVYLREALEISQLIGDYGLESITTLNIGAVRFYAGDIDGLLKYNKAALTIARKHNIPGAIKYATLNIALSFIQLKEYETAIQYLKGETGIRTKDNTILSASWHFIIAQSYLGQEAYELAQYHIDRCCAISNEIGYSKGVDYCHQFSTTLAEVVGDFELALHHFKLYNKNVSERNEAIAQRKAHSQQLQVLKIERDFQLSRMEEQRQREELEQAATRQQYISWGLSLFGVTLIGWLWLLARNKLQAIRQRKQLAEAKLQVLSSQMNPHFVFNAINGIQNQVLRAKKMEAYGYLGKFSELLRTISRAAEEVSIELEEEVKFLENYLELEKLRFRSDFDYEIIVSPGLQEEQLEISTMMIQPFVENALVHGLSQLPSPGKLTITLQRAGDFLHCVVRDNGRGRNAAAGRAKYNEKTHLSIASKNLRARIEFLRQSGYEEASVTINDLMEGGVPSGTEVILLLPFIR